MTLPLFDYQASAADLMATRNRFGLHDEMGIGKTATTIGTIDRTLGERGIIVCPAMLRENWIKEFEKFSPVPRRVCKGRNIHDFVAWSRGRFDVLVTSYELMTKWMPKFKEEGEFIDFVAFDEAHYLKNKDSNRTRALLGHEAGGEDSLVQWAENTWHVTGTPMANDPMDIYTFLQFVKAIDMPPDQFVDYFFEARLGTYSARHAPKPDMTGTLQQLIYGNSIRRTHKDVGMELPPVHLTEVLIEGKTIDLQKAMEAYPNLEQSVIEAIHQGNIEQLDAAYIAVLRRLLGKAKAVPYVELLKAEMDAGAGKRVIFCWHTEPLLYVQRAMAKYGYNFNVVYGGSTDTDAEAAIYAHQHDPDTHGTILNVKKGGTGLTLIEGNDIDMLESDWSPAGNAQALKRVHRYGQRNAVNARFITLANSFDVAVNRIVAGKTASIAEIEGHYMTATPLDPNR